jgi:hypothetical protein
MTTIITRLYDSAERANSVAGALKKAGFPASTYDVITQTGKKSALSQILAARVNAPDAELYAQNLSADRALLVVRAPFNPFGAARKAREIADGELAVDVGVPNENLYVREEPSPELFGAVLKDHPRFMSSDMVPGSGRYRGRFSEAFGIPLLSRRARSKSVYSERKLMLSEMLPFPVLLNRERKKSTLSSGPLTAQFMPLLARRFQTGPSVQR